MSVQGRLCQLSAELQSRPQDGMSVQSMTRMRDAPSTFLLEEAQGMTREQDEPSPSCLEEKQDACLGQLRTGEPRAFFIIVHI